MDGNERSLEELQVEALELLAAFSIPLYVDDGGRPDLHGTGFFVRDRENCYLVSAAHVMDTAASRGLHFYSSPNVLRRLTGELLRTPTPKGRGRDVFDIGVLKLSGDPVPPFPEVGKHAMDISYLYPERLPRTGRSYVLVGFPATKSRVNGRDRTARAAPFAFLAESLPERDYAGLGIDPRTHIAVAVDVKRGFGLDGIHKQFPKPQGMSGSPLTVFFEDEGPASARVFPVVGVAIEHRKDKKVIIATDVSSVLDAIAHAV